MDSSKRRAVITGVGVLSPIGSSPEPFWSALVEGQSGVRPIPHAQGSALSCQIGGSIPDFEPKKFITDREQRKNLGRMMARTVQLGVTAAQVAMNDVGPVRDHIDPTRMGVVFGAAMIHTDLEDISRAAKISTNCQPGSVSTAIWGRAGLKEIPPLWMLKYLPNMSSCHVSIFHNIQGPSNTITSGDVSSLLALGEAWRIVERDLVDFVLVGGTECKLNPLNFARQSLFQPLTRRNAEPARAVRPFDRDRDGTVLAEAATVYALEELSHARRRNAKIYAEVVGFGAGFDRGKRGVVLARVIRRALADAGIRPEDVDHVNAHGLGTADADRWEARGIAEVFGSTTPVWALKGHFGAAGPAGGLLELLGSVLSLRHGQVPPTLNCENPDPGCPIAVHNRGLRAVVKPYAVKVSLTERGQVAAAVIRKWEEQ